MTRLIVRGFPSASYSGGSTGWFSTTSSALHRVMFAGNQPNDVPSQPAAHFLMFAIAFSRISPVLPMMTQSQLRIVLRREGIAHSVCRITLPFPLR